MGRFPLIDVHQHVIPDVYRAALADIGVMGSGENPWPQWTLSRSLELMDENDIAALVISIASPGAYFGDVEFTRRLVRDCNEALARMVADRPTKFAAMGFVPLPDVAAAVREAEYALDVLGLDGINLLTHAGHRYLGHPEEDELYAELDRRRAVVFVHPVRPPLTGLPEFSFAAGYTELVFDTTRAIINLLYNGTLAKYPNIRFLMSHMGGVTPFLLFRLSGLDDDPKVRERIPDGVAAHLNRLYYDVAQSAAPLSLRALLDIADPSRIFFGTDYPFARKAEKVLKDTIAGVAGFGGFADDALRRKMSYENAQALFPRFASLPLNSGRTAVNR
jgi:predicted TIM-barrel fold metal-dependent hydrolase